MSQLEILVPYGLPPPELAADLLRELSAPSLATLISRASATAMPSRHERDHGFSRSLPHEDWLSRRFGLSSISGSSPPVAAGWMESLGLPAQDGYWFALQPVHIHIARDHLVLTDPRNLHLDEHQGRMLFDIAASLFAEADMPLLYGDRHVWFLRADQWSELQTASPDAASGHNIDIWMPKGPHERAWRKIQNEVQMHWFDHPVNMGREEHGLKPVNSIWLWGGAAGKAPRQRVFSHGFNLSGWLQSLTACVGTAAAAPDAAAAIATRAQSGLAVLDALLPSALSNDWAQWLEDMRVLESAWFAPLLDGLKSGALERLSLVFSNDASVSQFTVSRASLRKFWVKPSLDKFSS